MSPLTTPSSDNLLLGKGKVFFKRKVASGTASGFRHLGNVDTFELTTNDDVLEKNSSMEAAAPLYKRVTRKRDVVLRLTADEFVPENVALVLMGDVVQSAAQAGTAVTGEVLSDDVLLGGYYKTAKLGPITGVTVETGATPLVLGTDYTIYDANVGIIHILPTATAINDGDPLSIDYTPTAYASGLTTVNGGSDSIIEGELLFIGDPTTGPKYQVEVWSVSVTPDGAFGLISNDFAQMGLTMAVQSDAANHPDNHLYKLTYLP